MSAKLINWFAWGITAIVCLLAGVVWIQGLGGNLAALNSFTLFPLLGLGAFSLMWTHYIVGAVRRLYNVDKAPLKTYFFLTGWAAAIAILLHPSLLIYKLWANGLGLPPGSYLTYVGPGLGWAASLGTLSFLIFMSFEAKHWLHDKGWWPIIEYAQVVAMFAIVFHGLALGSNLQSGWYQLVWLIYAISLLISVAYIYYVDLKKIQQEGERMKKGIAIAVVAVIVIGLAVFGFSKLNSGSSTNTATTTTTSTTSSSNGSTTQQTFTAAEVQTHNSSSDCWTIIEGNVYDVTSYVNQHPGGNRILQACGVDATTLFATQGGEGQHSNSARQTLASFQIGTLSQ